MWLDNNHYVLTDKGMDISIPLRIGDKNVNAWYVDPVRIEAVVSGDFIGDVMQGGSVNFKNVYLNPHGNGTHTECIGHISKEPFTLNQCMKEFHFLAGLITIQPVRVGDDLVITEAAVREKLLGLNDETALIIRTLPNSAEKLTHHYSGTNPPYVDKEAIQYINGLGIVHLLIDLPSIDKERDNGAVVAHHVFWNYPANPWLHKTITELVYVDNQIKDGTYFLSFQITSLENDASPSKIMIYDIHRA